MLIEFLLESQVLFILLFNAPGCDLLDRVQTEESQVPATVVVLCPWDIKQMSKTIICTRIAAIAAVCCSLFRAELRHQSVHLRLTGLVQCAAQRYEDMKEGLISKTDFCDIRGQYDVRIADALIAQEQIDRELSIYLSGEQSPNNWMKTFTEHRGLKSLTRAVVLECIEKVVIHKDEKLEIIFEHSEDYARLVSSLQEYAERGILEEAM